jgi:hypothetical protein
MEEMRLLEELLSLDEDQLRESGLLELLDDDGGNSRLPTPYLSMNDGIISSAWK